MQMTGTQKSTHSIVTLRISIGIIYLWFGTLKFFPHVSPAEDLAKETIQLLTFNLIPRDFSLILLALWEVAVGFLLISGLFKRAAMVLVFTHMLCTFTPLVLLPKLSFTHQPYGLTLVGQYIIKNIVIVSALYVISSSEKRVDLN
jgi:uncharacterized membrane protein YphA (DoxX/SURF4 family)